MRFPCTSRFYSLLFFTHIYWVIVQWGPLSHSLAIILNVFYERCYYSPSYKLKRHRSLAEMENEEGSKHFCFAVPRESFFFLFRCALSKFTHEMLAGKKAKRISKEDKNRMKHKLITARNKILSRFRVCYIKGKYQRATKKLKLLEGS